MDIDGGNNQEDLTFQECIGLELAQDLIEIYEVTPQKWATAGFGKVVRTKIPGNIKVENLIFRRGMTTSTTLWNWIKEVYSGKWSQQRREGSLTVYNQAGEAQLRLNFLGAWPLRYQAADVYSDGDKIEIEELEVAFDMMERVMP
jgi:phage tail-like protein